MIARPNPEYVGRCAEVTEAVLHAVFHALHLHGIEFEHMILKPNMVLPGKGCRRASSEEVAEATLRVLKRQVPAAVPSINFLSGGAKPGRSHRQPSCYQSIAR